MNIKFLLISTAAAALLAGPALAADAIVYTPPAPPPPAAPVVAGDVEIGAGGGSESYDGDLVTLDDDDRDNFGLVTAIGRASVPLSGTIFLEGELNGRSVIFDGESIASFAAVGHLYNAAPEFAAGIFGGYTSIDDASGYVFGGEANYYAGPVTLFAQLAYWDGENYADGTLQGRLGAHFYVNPDTKLTLDGSYYGTDLVNHWTVDGTAEHRFTGTNWSGFLSAGYAASDEDWHSWTAKVGFKLLVDPPGSTLQGHDKAVPFNVKLPVFVPVYYDGPPIDDDPEK
jgi:hypothetical protein